MGLHQVTRLMTYQNQQNQNLRQEQKGNENRTVPETKQRNQRRGGIKLRLKLNQQNKAMKQTKIQITKMNKRRQKKIQMKEALRVAIENAEIHAIFQQ